MPLSPGLFPGLYAITPTAAALDEQWLYAAVAELLAGGCTTLQYRDKYGDRQQQLRRAKSLRRILDQAPNSPQLIVNDQLELALETDAHGVHLGQQDGCVKTARRLLGDEKLLGVTCHNSLELAKKAIAEGADYVAFGRFFPSQTKGDAPAASMDLFKEAQNLGVPTVAIGGITLVNAPLLIAAGAFSIAVSHDIFSQPLSAMAAQVRSYQSLFNQPSRKQDSP